MAVKSSKRGRVALFRRCPGRSPLVRDLDLAMFDNMDERRFFRGAQLAVDTTLVCPLTREGRARPQSPTKNGAAFEQARRAQRAALPRVSRRRREGPSRRSCWRSGRSVLRRDSPLLEEPRFSQGSGLARDPARQGPRCLGAQMELDVGVHGGSLVRFVSLGPGPCWCR